MKKLSRSYFYGVIIAWTLWGGRGSSALSQGIFFDHTHTDLSQIPSSWIDAVQANCRLHYAHTSHGEQLTTGLEVIENADATYSFARELYSLPNEPGAFCIFDGQEDDDYITPELYWQTTDGLNRTRNVLNHNPTINYSMWAWCTQLDYLSEGEVQAYLDAMTQLESEFPDVSFIYMTGNAQATDWEGYNRYLRNQQIRQYCTDHAKILFDFADLDSWWYNPNSHQWERATYDYDGSTVPTEHSQFYGDEAGHTTVESCEQKGRALWWMMAHLSGWDGPTQVQPSDVIPIKIALYQNVPNPFNPTTQIRYQIPKSSRVTLKIHNLLGREVRTLVNGVKSVGPHVTSWDGKDATGRRLSSGIYFYRLEADNTIHIRKMILME